MVQVIATTQLFNQLTSIAWVKVFRITTEFCIFRLPRGHFSKSCKSCEFSGMGSRRGCTFCIDHYSQLVDLPRDHVYYRAAAFILCRVHSGIILYKSAQTIHKSQKQHQQQHKLVSPKRGRWRTIMVTDNWVNFWFFMATIRLRFVCQRTIWIVFN